MNQVCGEALVSRAITHRGRVRAENQDAVLESPEAGLWLVADGMGGHDRGDLASRAIVQAVQALVEHRRGQALAAGLAETLELVNEQLRRYARQSGLDVVGSTVAALVLEGEHYHCFWVGDSRIYLFRDGGLRQLTEDHTEASGALNRAVGAEAELEVDYLGGTIYQDDVFLLCTDGLNKVVGDQGIADCLDQLPALETCQALVDAALAGGAPDNVSCLTVFVRGGSSA